MSRRRCCPQIYDLRWPLRPLLDVTGLSARDFRRRVNTSDQLVACGLAEGVVDEVAEQWAYACGRLPHEVWGWDWFDAALTPLDEAHVAGGWRQAWLWDEQSERGERRAA